MGGDLQDPEESLSTTGNPVKLLYLTVENMNLSKGPAVHVLEIVRRLREMGCKVTLVASGNPRAEGAPVFMSIGKKASREGTAQKGITMLWRFIRLFLFAHLYLRSHDLVYARDYHVALICILPKVIFRRRLVYEINGLASEEWSMKGNTVLHQAVALIIKVSENLAARGADRIVAVTEGLKQHLVGDLREDATKIAVVPNGVDTQVFHPMDGFESVESLRTCLGIQKDETVVLFAGNLAPWQGIDTLLDSVPTILKHVPRVRLLIVGQGILREQLMEHVRRLNLKEYIVFTGMVLYEEVPCYISLADVCVSPKRRYRTGLSPLKIYEYMACGKAVVSSRVAGLDFIAEKGVGLLVEPDNPEALAEGIVELLLDPQKRARMGRNGARVARQECDWGKRARAIIKIFPDKRQIRAI